MGQLELSYIGKATLDSGLAVSYTVKIDLSYDPAILLLAI